MITIDPSSTRLLARALLDVKYEATLLARGAEMIGVEGKAVVTKYLFRGYGTIFGSAEIHCRRLFLMTRSRVICYGLWLGIFW